MPAGGRPLRMLSATAIMTSDEITREPPYALERLRVVMEPDPGDPREAWGVLNPGGSRGRDGELYLFPRLVAEGNFSRIGKARVLFDGDEPVGVERLGVALEPDEAWERNARTGGVEDARVTLLGELGVYVMTYTAYGPLGPRIGLAISPDLASWERLGPASFAYDPALGTDLNLYPNKNAMLFPEAVPGPHGERAYAMLHRPMWDLSSVAPGEGAPLPSGVTESRSGIWVSFAPAEACRADLRALPRFAHHRAVALPEQPWEELKIGAGTPPLRTAEGWLVLYHGVAGRLFPGRDHQPAVCYSAGALLLDPADVSRVVARSSAPLLEPETREEREGIVPNVLFPTALDARSEDSADVYYGMADSRIGAARLTGRSPGISTPAR